MVAEVSDPRRRITGPVGAVAREFFKFNNAEPYVYTGPVANKTSPAWIAAGAIGIAAVVVFVAMGSELSDAGKSLKKAQADLATANGTISVQLDHLAMIEKQKATEQSLRDQDERDAKAKLDKIKDAVTAAMSDEVAQRNVVVAVDGKHTKVELSDRVMFEDKGIALTDSGKKTLAKLAAAAKKMDANVEIVSTVDSRSAKPASKKDVMPADSWSFSAARAAVVAKSLEDDDKIASSKIAAKGLGRAKSRRLEIDLTP
jgi:flagellar motor protein MotB